ncbi:MAG: hypothetical protein JWN34_3499 [Bryobacterales bacterium]|nr:hypothetical protein [Bryobacterales bacterium]
MIRLTRAALLVALAPWLAPAAVEWTRVATPNFELYTSAGEKAGIDMAVHFEQVRAFFAKASPVKPPGDVPLRIIAFSSAEQFRAFSPNALAAAFFTAGPGRDYIVMRDTTPDSYAFAVHEYMHFVVQHSGLKIPTWLNEGWADVYSSMRRVSDGMAVGDLIPMRMKILEASTGAWLDFNTLTSVTTRSPIYNEGDRTGLFYGQSWALTHMLFLSPEYHENFGKFLLSLHRGASASEACQTAFGKSAPVVAADARAYFDRRKLVGRVFQISLDSAGARPLPAALPEFDARLMLADLQVATRRADLARLEYERLEKLNPSHVDLQRSMGYLFAGLRDASQARKHFELAFAAGATDAKLCYNLALMQLAAKEPLPTVIASLERAVTTLPTYTEALIQLGLVRSLNRDFPQAVEAFMAVPAVTAEMAPPFFNALAYAFLQTGDLDQARAHLATARKYVQKPAESAVLDNVSKLIDARAASAFPPHPGEQIVQVQGSAVGIACSATGQRLQVQTERSGLLALDLPAMNAIEIVHAGKGTLQMACGPAKPFPVFVEYAKASALRQDSAGVLRLLSF